MSRTPQNPRPILRIALLEATKLRDFASLIRHPGNDSLFKAVEMSIVSTLRGQPFHLHVEGGRGTGKTTVIRSARAVLPAIERVKGCIYNCDPHRPHCPTHRSMDPAELGNIGTEWIRMPFLEISPSAKIGTVVGSIDLEKMTNGGSPEVALLPGTIPQAHRGIIFVDEINRLSDVAPELADVLLDVMGTKPGRIQIEETGLPRVEMPVTVTVWSASNPDEEPGPLEEIRRQLSDRFDVVVKMRRPNRLETVQAILEMFEQEIGLNREKTSGETDFIQRASKKGDELSAAAGRLETVEIPEPIRTLIAKLYLEFSLESFRGIEAILYGSKLVATISGRNGVRVEDLVFLIPLALSHRVEPQLIPRILTFVENWDKDRSVVAGSGSETAGRVNDGKDRSSSVPDALRRGACDAERDGLRKEYSSAEGKGNQAKGIANRLWEAYHRLVRNESQGAGSGPDDYPRSGGSGEGMGDSSRGGDLTGSRGSSGTDRDTGDQAGRVESPPAVARPLLEMRERLVSSEEELRC